MEFVQIGDSLFKYQIIKHWNFKDALNREETEGVKKYQFLRSEDPFSPVSGGLKIGHGRLGSSEPDNTPQKQGKTWQSPNYVQNLLG